MTRALAAIALLLSACIPEDGPMMRPGEDCLGCHGFTAAGTVFDVPDAVVDDGVKGVRVHLTGADGTTVTVRSNEAGNFYTKERLVFPLEVRVEKDGRSETMDEPAPDGRCNRCHTLPPLEDAPGRVALEDDDDEGS
jgi:hypothetical protein